MKTNPAMGDKKGKFTLLDKKATKKSLGWHLVLDSNETVSASKKSVIAPILLELADQYAIPVKRASLEDCDFFLVLDADPEHDHPDEETGLIVEFKSKEDALNNAGAGHDHLRGQINAMHRSEASIGGRMLMILADLDAVAAAARKLQDREKCCDILRRITALETLEVRCLLEHPNPVHVKFFKAEDDIAQFLLTAGETLLERRSGKKRFDSVERVNESLKRKRPESDEDYLELHLREVRGVGKDNAYKIAKKYGSIRKLSAKYDDEGSGALRKAGDLGEAYSRKVGESFGRPPPEKKKKE